MKVYDIIIEPETRMSDMYLENLTKKIRDNLFIVAYPYTTLLSPSDEKTTKRISIKNIRENAVPDLLMFLDNIAWKGYKVIHIEDLTL